LKERGRKKKELQGKKKGEKGEGKKRVRSARLANPFLSFDTAVVGRNRGREQREGRKTPGGEKGGKRKEEEKKRGGKKRRETFFPPLLFFPFSPVAAGGGNEKEGRKRGKRA